MTDTIRIPAQHVPAQQPSGAPRPTSGRRLLIGVRAFTGLNLAGVAVFSTLAAEHDWLPRFLLGGATCLILAALGGALLVLERMLASRRAAYRDGQLAGWWCGWNGQPPGSN